MAYDLIIRGGRVVDGSGLPSYVADIGVKDGKIAEVGRLKDGAARIIDAVGLAVAPGFIDHHTHLAAPWGAAGWACRPCATSAICARTASRWQAGWPTTKNYLPCATCWRIATPA